MGKWTRRGFVTAGVIAGGGFIVGVAIRPGNRTAKLSSLVAADDEMLVNSWVKISADNRITAIIPHCEMGQGAHTSLTQMLADEMDADWALVSMMEAPAKAEYANYPLARGFLGGFEVPAVLSPTVNGIFLQATQFMNLQITGGSASVRATGVYGMRVAGAAAREMLLTAAADAWQVPRAELTARDSMIVHKASKRSEPYATFASAAGRLTPPAEPPRKRMEDFKFMGKSVPRFDIPAKVDGSARFGIDAEVPGMKYASIVRSPVFGGEIVSLDDRSARDMAGVRDVIDLGNAVAVIADGYWQAQQALAKVGIEWDTKGNDAATTETIFQQFGADLDSATEREAWQADRELGDVSTAFAEADQIIEAEYRVPYLAHAPMEPLNATAWVRDGICEVWTSCQNPLGFRAEIAAALDVDDETVIVHNAYLGGGFGRRAQGDYAVQAARLSAAAGMPVKLIWSREEDIRQDNYRPAVMSRFRAALDANGRLLAWQNQYVDKHEPSEAPLIPYAIDNQLIRYTDSPTHVPFGPWRSVDHSQHGFFTESFADEVAVAAGQDGYQFRRDLLKDSPRERAVLDLAAEKSGWGASLPEGRGRGISLQYSFGTVVAQVVDVTVSGGDVRVDRVVCAVDPGFAVSPDGLVAQMESGIIYGLTAALYGEIYIDDGAVAQSNFHDYQMLRMAESPVIETYIINSGAPWGGAGEPGTPGIAPALANAIFDATGTRIRRLPVKNYDLQFRILEPEEVV